MWIGIKAFQVFIIQTSSNGILFICSSWSIQQILDFSCKCAGTCMPHSYILVVAVGLGQHPQWNCVLIYIVVLSTCRNSGGTSSERVLPVLQPSSPEARSILVQHPQKAKNGPVSGSEWCERSRGWRDKGSILSACRQFHWRVGLHVHSKLQFANCILQKQMPLFNVLTLWNLAS